MAYITKGIKLSYKSGGASTYTDLTNLQDIPDLGGDVDSIEITTLNDDAHIYMNGLKDYGDSLDFKFIYDTTQFTTLKALTGSIEWKVTLPDGVSGGNATAITFSGEPNVKLNGGTYNEAMTYTLSIKPNSAMVVA